MNEKRTAQRRLFHGHGLFVLFICIAAAGSILSGTLLAFFRPEASTKVSERTLTFPERVAYQRAIEDVYWRHRIWPARNTKPKPSLAEMMSAAQIAKKVGRLSPRLASAGNLLAQVNHSRPTASRDGSHGPEHKAAGSVTGNLVALGKTIPLLLRSLSGQADSGGAFRRRCVDPRQNCGRREALRSYYLQQLNRVPAIDSISEAVQVNRPYQLPRIIAGASITCTDDRWTATNVTIPLPGTSTRRYGPAAK